MFLVHFLNFFSFVSKFLKGKEGVVIYLEQFHIQTDEYSFIFISTLLLQHVSALKRSLESTTHTFLQQGGSCCGDVTSALADLKPKSRSYCSGTPDKLQ